MSDNLTEKIIPLEKRITAAQVERMIELVKNECIEAVKQEPDFLPNSDEIQRWFVRGIDYAVHQIKKV